MTIPICRVAVFFLPFWQALPKPVWRQYNSDLIDSDSISGLQFLYLNALSIRFIDLNDIWRKSRVFLNFKLELNLLHMAHTWMYFYQMGKIYVTTGSTK